MGAQSRSATNIAAQKQLGTRTIDGWLQLHGQEGGA